MSRWSGNTTPLMVIGTALRNAKEPAIGYASREDMRQIGIAAIRRCGRDAMLMCVQYCERRIAEFSERPQSRKTRTAIRYYDRWRRLVGSVLVEHQALLDQDERFARQLAAAHGVPYDMLMGRDTGGVHFTDGRVAGYSDMMTIRPAINLPRRHGQSYVNRMMDLWRGQDMSATVRGCDHLWDAPNDSAVRRRCIHCGELE